MKAIYLHCAGAIALTFALGACVSGVVPSVPSPATTEPVRAPSAAPAPAPSPVSTAQPLPVIQEPVYNSYLDAPQTPGTWGYADDRGETLAYYGVGEDYRFIVRCDKQTRQIGLARVAQNASLAPRAMEITTETTKRTLTANSRTSTGRLIAAELSPRDSLLDAMAITKGRIAVGMEGERTLYLPAWVEISRVIEDCR